MTTEELIKTFDKEQEDEALKVKTIKEELEGLETPPDETVIQALMRIIRKPSIPEASEGVYDAVVEYLKGISRY